MPASILKGSGDNLVRCPGFVEFLPKTLSNDRLLPWMKIAGIDIEIVVLYLMITGDDRRVPAQAR